MIIKVFSRKDIAKEIYHLDKPTLVISISDYGDHCPWELRFPHENLFHTVACSFDDVGPNELYPMRQEDAQKIFSHTKNYVNRYGIQQILVHCNAGISRSSAIAAALMKYYNGDNMDIFTNPKYHPNSWCYCLMLKEIAKEGE